MSKKEKTIIDPQTEARNELIQLAGAKKIKHAELREKALKLKEDLKAEGADKAKIEKEFEAAKQASLKAKEEFDAARIKASQFVKVKDSVLTMEKPSAFIPPVKEQGHVHVELDKTRFDKDTGEKLSKAYIQIFTPRAFKDFKKNTLGFKVQVIWDGETFKSI